MVRDGTDRASSAASSGSSPSCASSPIGASSGLGKMGVGV